MVNSMIKMDEVMNVQIGSLRCMQYVVRYISKTNLKEDKGIDVEKIGMILHCKFCKENDTSSGLTTTDVSDMFLSSMKRKFDISDQDPGNIFPPSKYRRDILSYRYPSDLKELNEQSEFYTNTAVRHHISTHNTNEHDFRHRPSCFKYDSECRYNMPFCSKCSTEFVGSQ